MFVVTVWFTITEDSIRAFHEAVLSNAARTLEEAGCRVFDVCATIEGERVFLYELYDDEAAYDYHLTTSHFVDFNAQSAPWVREKTVETLTTVSEWSGQTGSDTAGIAS